MIDIILDSVQHAYADEKVKQEFIQFIKENPNNFHDRENVNGHITGSMLVFNEDMSEVLLTLHKGLDKWLQLGGHWDNFKETVLETAIREMFEEGFGNQEIPYELIDVNAIDLDKHSVGPHNHYDVCFAAKVSNEAIVMCSHESKEVGWKSVKDVMNNPELYEPRLAAMILKAQEKSF